jgi:ribonuclease P protein component
VAGRALGKLSETADFERVRTEGARWRGRFCVLNAARALSLVQSPALTRVGYITSKKLGNAVKRNRARRLLRESIHALRNDIPDGWDLVLIAQSALSTENARLHQVREEIHWLLNKAIMAK